MAKEDQARIGRRALLAAGAGGAAVAAAHALAGPARVLGADGDNVRVGQINSGNGVTTIESAASDGIAALSHTNLKSGLYGANSNPGGFGVYGRNTNNANIGFLGGPNDAVAGQGHVAGASGVYGDTVVADGFGVTGRYIADGLLGWFAGQGIGVYAEAPTALTALKVKGKTRFSRSGVVTVPAGKRTVKKSSVPLTSASFVLATIQQDRLGVFVEAAVPSVAGSSFTIYLNKVVASATKVAWLVLD